MNNDTNISDRCGGETAPVGNWAMTFRDGNSGWAFTGTRDIRSNRTGRVSHSLESVSISNGDCWLRFYWLALQTRYRKGCYLKKKELFCAVWYARSSFPSLFTIRLRVKNWFAALPWDYRCRLLQTRILRVGSDLTGGRGTLSIWKTQTNHERTTSGEHACGGPKGGVAN
jgi:hypothetical protein